MKTFIEICPGLEVLEIKGFGCLSRAKAGGAIDQLPGVFVNQDGELFADESAHAAVDTAIARKGPVGQAEGNVKGFLETMKTKNFTSAGEYGGYGPYLLKLREVLIGQSSDSPIISSLGTFLTLGDHPRYGYAAPVMMLDASGLEELAAVLTECDPAKVEAFVDKCVTGLKPKPAAGPVSVMDGQVAKPVAA
jgi:hypothetical protein